MLVLAKKSENSRQMTEVLKNIFTMCLLEMGTGNNAIYRYFS